MKIEKLSLEFSALRCAQTILPVTPHRTTLSCLNVHSKHDETNMVRKDKTKPNFCTTENESPFSTSFRIIVLLMLYHQRKFTCFLNGQQSKKVIAILYYGASIKKYMRISRREDSCIEVFALKKPSNADCYA
ncbi:hypothetical protein NPIL_538001 [Nephila pilipes]|uniref:Uncharacterized protein n=1 Tax=Nephila pilipes TaxID=299642 RepID=A0A8X6TU73_NEPPI|nr:hypothetical protein NPIL_538001 [Nephila pilipes]